MTEYTDWDAGAVARLRTLWAEGHSAAEIGRRMGLTKNAILGKAHRLDLPGRLSPIRKLAEGAPRKPRAPRVNGPTLPLVPSAAPPAAAPAPAATRTKKGRACRPPESAVAAVPPSASPSVPKHSRLPPRSCCWPIGDPGTKGFRFCDADAALGKPYCLEHAETAFVKPKSARTRADGAPLDRYFRRVIGAV